jgi:hypothetical protein
MSIVRRGVAVLALALPLSGCLTLVGTAGGAIYASTKNSEVAVQQGDKARTSVGKSVAAGAAIGFVLDVALIAIAISAGDVNIGH